MKDSYSIDANMLNASTSPSNLEVAQTRSRSTLTSPQKKKSKDDDDDDEEEEEDLDPTDHSLIFVITPTCTLMMMP